MSCGDCTGCVFDSSRPQLAVAQQIHVTVAPCDSDAFIEACASLGTKALLINNFVQGERVRELITSNTCYGSDGDALEEMWRIAGGLQALGMTVVRRKIEVSPVHPLVPKRSSDNRMRTGQYFESHIAVSTPTADCMAALQNIRAPRFHLSASESKGGEVTMATVRAHTGTIESFKERIEESVMAIRSHGLDVERAIIEFARYDSNVELDKNWMT